jgi:hypothetical protein
MGKQAVLQFEFFPYSNHLRNVILKGVSEFRVLISGRGARDDGLFIKDLSPAVQTAPLPANIPIS